MERGKFITFEGIDGCGKSTQLHLLHRYIWDMHKHFHIVKTREPYINREMRNILTRDADPYTRGLELAQLFVADRRQHANELIIPNLNLGTHMFVLSDRYDLSTLAYQQTQGVPLATLREMHEGLPVPDLTFIVDIPVGIAIERMRKDLIRSAEQKFEKNPAFMEKLRRNYLALAEQLTGRNIVVVDSTAEPDVVFGRYVRPAFDRLMKESGKL